MGPRGDKKCYSSYHPLRTMTHTLAILGGTPAFAQPIYVTRAVTPPRETFLALADRLLDSRVLTNAGPNSLALEAALAAVLGVPECVALCNGTVALQVALAAAGACGEIITTPFTFPATVHAFAWMGMSPVFCDIDPDTLNLTPATAAAAIGTKTGGILPVHTFGTPCDVHGFDALSKQSGVPVVYDAAHAFGVRVAGRGIGEFGAATMFSFHATKLFSTCEGGAITTNDPAIAKRARLMRNFGYENDTTIVGIGINGKLSELHAAFGLACLDGLDLEIAQRLTLSQRYTDGLACIPGIRIPAVPTATQANGQYMPILIDAEEYGLSRDQLLAVLTAENVVPRRYFFPLCSSLPAYRDLPSAHPDRLPVAHRVAASVLCLPLYGDLPLDGPDRIIDVIARAQAEAQRIRTRCQPA